VHDNTVGGQFAGDDPGQTQQSGLRRAIVGPRNGAVHPGRHGADIHNAAPTALTHARSDSPDAVEGTVEVDVHNRMPLFQIHLGHRFAQPVVLGGNTGVVDEDIHRPQIALDRVHHGVYLGVVAHVGPEIARLSTVLAYEADGLFAPLIVEV